MRVLDPFTDTALKPKRHGQDCQNFSEFVRIKTENAAKGGKNERQAQGQIM